MKKLQFLSLLILFSFPLTSSNPLSDMTIENNIDIHEMMNNLDLQESPLSLAAQSGNLPLMQQLIAQGDDVDSRDILNVPILHRLANNPHATEILLQAGANPNIQDDFGYTPLHEAVKSNNIDTIQRLIAHHANINLQNNQGNTPLHLAIMLHHLESLHQLINANPHIDIRNNHGQTISDLPRTYNERALLLVFRLRNLNH